MATHTHTTQTQTKHSHTSRAVLLGSVLITAAIVFLALMLRPSGSNSSTPPAIAKHATPRTQIIQPTAAPQPKAQPTPIWPGTKTVYGFEGRSVNVKESAQFTVGQSWWTAFTYSCVNTPKDTVHFSFDVVDSTGYTVYTWVPNTTDKPNAEMTIFGMNNDTLKVNSPQGGTYRFVVHTLRNCQWQIYALE